MTVDPATADPERDPAYRYGTLMGLARAGRLEGEGFRELEKLRTSHPELAEDDR